VLLEVADPVYIIVAAVHAPKVGETGALGRGRPPAAVNARAEKIALYLFYTKGFMIFNEPSMTCPCCKSSEYKIGQLLSIADATMRLS